MKEETTRLSASLEDYLKEIYLLNLEGQEVRITDIARSLGISKPSVNRAMNTLKELELLEHEHYGKITLTDAGRDTAKNILDTNKIVYRFLTEILDVDEQTALAEADLIFAETSCDGKKKMYELLSRQNRVYYYQVAQGADRDYVNPLIYSECKCLAKELEKRFGTPVTDDAIRSAGALYNQERESILNLMEIQCQIPPAAWGRDIFHALEEHRTLPDVKERTAANRTTLKALSSQDSPVPKYAKRILVTGCPLSGVHDKILEAIEDNGGVVVCFENCEVMKAAVRHFDTEKEDVYAALADCYQNTACAIMSPNYQRFELLARLVQDYKVDGILDITLQTCHPYTVERDKMVRFCEDSLGIPYMAVETDAGESDKGQLTTRITAFIEML